jgi:hypothetical protein
MENVRKKKTFINTKTRSFMYQKYYTFARIRTVVALAAAAMILTAQAFAHLDLHCDIPEPMKEQQEKDRKEREARESYDRYMDDPDNASDRDRSEAIDFQRDYTN